MLNLKYLPVQFSFFLGFGILTGYYFQVSLPVLFFIFLIMILVLTVVYYRSNKLIRPTYSFAFFTSIVFLLIGIISIQFTKPINQKQHYLNKNQSYNHLAIKIISVLKPTDYYFKYEGRIIKIDDKKVSGKVLVNINKDQKIIGLAPDDIIMSSSELLKISSAKNPSMFDYQKFLYKKGIYRQITLSKGEFILVNNNKRSLKGIAFTIRKKIMQRLAQYDFTQDELAIISALLLGQRQDISKEVFESYKNAGAIHILAISGLHVGIILLMLNYLFKPLEKLKKGKYLKLLIIVLLLWIYAFIAGLSASVIRAVSMFTAVAIGMISNRTSGVKNSLVISFFMLLLISPLYLFDVGFQLSYIAVFSIVFIQPVWTNLWRPKHKFINYFWQLFTVSISAQLGILPLSLYYFHQFPALFFISSLVIIPFLGFILGFGIVIILLSSLHLLPSFIATIYGEVINYMNNFVVFISAQEQFIFRQISFSLFLTITFYVLLLSLLSYYYKKSYLTITVILVSIISLQGYFIYQKRKGFNSDKLTVFQSYKNTIIENKIKNRVYIYTRTDSINKAVKQIVKTIPLRHPLTETININALQNTYQFQGKNVLIIDESAIYRLQNFATEIIILSQSPKINLERVIQFLMPKLIIADGSNYKKDIAIWEKTCHKFKVKFYNTVKKGAFEQVETY